MKRYLQRAFLAAAALMMAFSAQAVLKEKNFSQTLNVLRAELEQSYLKQKSFIAMYEQRAEEQHEELILTMQKYNQISLILYSQQEGFTFDMAYACQQATELYRSIHHTNVPHDKMQQQMQSEIERYDLLISTLEELPPSLKMQAINEEKQSLNKKRNQEADSLKIEKMMATLDSIAQAHGEDAFSLDEDEEINRNECLIYAKALRNNIARLKTQMDRDAKSYERVNSKVNELNEYAQKKYESLRNNIFNNRGENYFNILLKLPSAYSQYNKETIEKYKSFPDYQKGKDGHVYNNKSQWRGKIIPLTSFFVFIYVLISSLLSFVIIHWLLPKSIRSKENFKKKEPVLLVACGFLIFMISVSIIRTFLFNNFLIMAIGLLLEFSWLIVFILLSLLFRLDGNQIKEGTKQYTPFLVMAFIVIVFRIIFIPNSIVNIIFPPIVLLFTIWQAMTLKKRTVEIPNSDLVFSYISLASMIVSCVLSFIGYTLIAVEVMIWWTFQLACIQTINFFYDICRLYEKKYIVKRLEKEYRASHKGILPTDAIRTKIEAAKEKLKEATEQAEIDNINKQISNLENKLNRTIFNIQENMRVNMSKGVYFDKTYLFDFVIIALIPILAVLSVLFSLYMAADLFDMTDIFMDGISYTFLKTSYINLSINKLFLVLLLFFLFKYLNYGLHAGYKILKKKRDEIKIEQERRKMEERGLKGQYINQQNENLTLANNIISILVWGSYFVFILFFLNVPKSGITIITGGLATGLGFAMKDLLENFFYGLSLMTGRVRIGDYIECEGITGKVDSITYQSTQMVTADGSVIAFLNSQLFTKNFKNLTRNHKYEQIKVVIGVAYGVKVQTVRDILTASINSLIEKKREKVPNITKPGTSVAVGFDDFGDSSVNLKVLVWVLVEEIAGFTSEIKENIYNALNDNNIEIPFPQQDVHIRN